MRAILRGQRDGRVTGVLPGADPRWLKHPACYALPSGRSGETISIGAPGGRSARPQRRQRFHARQHRNGQLPGPRLAGRDRRQGRVRELYRTRLGQPGGRTGTAEQPGRHTVAGRLLVSHRRPHVGPDSDPPRRPQRGAVRDRVASASRRGGDGGQDQHGAPARLGERPLRPRCRAGETVRQLRCVSRGTAGR